LTQKERETLEKPYVDASDKLREKEVKSWEDGVKRAAKARKSKASTEGARQKLLDETIDELAAEVRGKNKHLSDLDVAKCILARVNEGLVEAGHKQTSKTRIRARLRETRG
jgi:hypothetical protein